MLGYLQDTQLLVFLHLLQGIMLTVETVFVNSTYVTIGIFVGILKLTD
jgi:hypothetical protein